MKQKYKETQRFNDKLVFLVLIAGLSATLLGLTRSLILGSIGWEKALIYVLSTSLLAGTLWYLRQLKLKVSVNDSRIKFKLFPFQKQSQRITWDQVDSCRLVRSPRAAQWHGGNLHFSRERWYSLSGRNGLLIETKDGQHYFIGCRNLDRLKQVLVENGLSSS
ncbi:MAG: hypothetical protein KDC44_23205 [Phaeodactylibacter sp.]|nr:hypothetical protein [Phaeodactylibacter sp.]